MSTFVLILMPNFVENLNFFTKEKGYLHESFQIHQNIVLFYCLKLVILLMNFAARILGNFQPFPEFPNSQE